MIKEAERSTSTTPIKLVTYETEKSLVAGQWSTMIAAVFLGGIIFVLLPYMKQRTQQKITVKVTQIKTLDRKVEKKIIEKPEIIKNKPKTKKVSKPQKITPLSPPKINPMPKLKLSVNLSSAFTLPQVEFKHNLNFKTQAPIAVQKLPEEVPSVEIVTTDTDLPVAKDYYDVGDLDKPLKARRRVAPIYPRKARRLNKEGFVHVSFIVDENGKTSDFKILKSEPKGLFEKSALNAVKKWRFNPGTVDGQAVKVRVDLPLQFQLR